MSEHITRRAFQNAIAPLATRRELEIWNGALIGRMDAQFETLQLHMDAMQRNMEAMQRELQRDMDAMRREMRTDLARHGHAMFESTRVRTGAAGEDAADPAVTAASASRAPIVEPR
jgi:hypothetical protein